MDQITENRDSVLSTVGLEVVTPRVKEVFELGSISVTCSPTQNYSSPISYSWSFDGKAAFSQTGPTLSLVTMQRRNAGVYTCHAYLHDDPSSVATATVEVIVQCELTSVNI